MQTERVFPKVTEAEAAVLQAAMVVIAARGIADTRVEDLLEAAQISRRTFYKYFRNKEDVLVALYQFSSEILYQEMERVALPAVDWRQSLIAAIDCFLEFHSSQGALVRMLQQEAMRQESPLAACRSRLHDRLVQMLDDVMVQLQGRYLDTLVYYAMLSALEGISLRILNEQGVLTIDLAQAKRVMHGVAEHLLAPSNETRQELPTRILSQS
jgi:AcrR family transcriptional regulator